MTATKSRRTKQQILAVNTELRRRVAELDAALAQMCAAKYESGVEIGRVLAVNAALRTQLAMNCARFEELAARVQTIKDEHGRHAAELDRQAALLLVIRARRGEPVLGNFGVQYIDGQLTVEDNAVLESGVLARAVRRLFALGLLVPVPGTNVRESTPAFWAAYHDGFPALAEPDAGTAG